VKWRTVDQYYAVSDCGFYTVSKSCGIHGEPIYTAWYRIGARPSSTSFKKDQPFPAPTHLGLTNMFRSAADLCGYHQQQQRKRPNAA
jgi:hypothetical protein